MTGISPRPDDINVGVPDRPTLATRTAHRLLPDPRRVLIKLFVAGQEDFGVTESRTALVLDRILALSEDEVRDALSEVSLDFANRHVDFHEWLDRHAHRVVHRVDSAIQLSEDRWRLIGACFTHEFAVEGAALCNPSAVLHPDQTGVSAGAARFVMSVRGIGEGHRSSIGFRTGIVDQWGGVTIDSPAARLESGVIGDVPYGQSNFRGLLESMSDYGENARAVFGRLGAQFTISELEEQLNCLLHDHETYRNAEETVHHFRTIAERSYAVTFSPLSDLSERVLWPHAWAEWRGMEDARLVRFVNDDASHTYYGTYTAFDGTNISQQMFSTDDFATFSMFPASGNAARGKGLAVFPRKIGGRYVALSRSDNESNSVAFSDHIDHWEHSEVLQAPRRPWEIIQLGNSGSPVETDAGWLVITHAVGPFRTYYLSAILLDANDPMRIIGSLQEPLLAPISRERDGYVPNVVYSCGSLLHGNVLMIPFGIADNSIGIATVDLATLLSRLVP